MQFTTKDADLLMEILTWRRDVRHFLKKPIPCSVKEALSKAIDLAPSVGNSRPWRIVNVESVCIRNKVLDSHLMANEAAREDYDAQTKADYQALKLAGLREAPMHLAFFTDCNPEAGRGLGRQTMPETLVYSTITAIHQLWLVARAHNIGVGWVSILEPEKMNNILEVNPEWLFTAYLCLGYPQEKSKTPELHRKRWQENISVNWIDR